MSGIVFLENRKPMNVQDPKLSSPSSNSPVSAESASSVPPGARVEPCEFESLLRRAMEIMNSRARAATSPNS